MIFLTAVLKTQAEKSGPSLTGIDLDKNIKLYHSKSLSEIPQYPNVGHAEEGKESRKVFEKRWSSSAIDLNMAQSMIQVCLSFCLFVCLFVCLEMIHNYLQ